MNTRHSGQITSAFSREIQDLSENIIFQLGNHLNVAACGTVPVVTIARRMNLPSEVVDSLLPSRTQHATKDLFNYLSVFGTDEQRKLSYIIQKMREYPPMNGPAKILESANKI